jgi:hypothetical protein
MLRRLSILCALSLAMIGAGPAQAGTTTGDFSVSWAGAGEPSPFEPAAALAWTFSYASFAGNTGGDRPAALTSVSQAAVTTPCDENPDLGSITSSVSAIASAPAKVNVAPSLDLRRHVGTVLLRSSSRDSGMAQYDTDRECVDAPDNGVTSMPVPADSLVHRVITAKPWPIHQLKGGAWVGSGTQSVSFGAGAEGFAPQLQTMHVRLVGSPESINAVCLVPTPASLRPIRTRRAALAFLASAGFPRPHVISERSVRVPAGRWFVREQNAVDRYLGCGPASVTLVLSKGRG